MPLLPRAAGRLPAEVRTFLSVCDLAPPGRTPTDLRLWGLLEVTALETVLPQAYPAPDFYWREWRRPATRDHSEHTPCGEEMGVLAVTPAAPAEGDIVLFDLQLLREVAWLFPPAGEAAPIDPERLVHTLGCLYWAWPPEGGDAALLDYPSAVRSAWSALRPLASELRSPFPPEPTADTPRACRNTIDLVMGWCLECEGHVPPASPVAVPTKKAALSHDEANAAVRKHLQEHPAASVRKVSEATGISTGRISKLPGRQAHLATRAGKAPVVPELNERPITDSIPGSIGVTCDPGERIAIEEAARAYLLKHADPKEKARLLKMSSADRAELIAVTIARYREEVEEERDSGEDRVVIEAAKSYAQYRDAAGRLRKALVLTGLRRGEPVSLIARAGLDKRDGAGRALEFHALRYFFCTQLARSMPMQKVRVLMRHRTPRPTCDLDLDLGLGDIADDVWALPPLVGATVCATASGKTEWS